jgi:hypothetical protein
LKKGEYKGDFPDSGTIIFNYHYMPSRVCSAIFYITSFPPIILFGAIFLYTEGLITLFWIDCFLIEIDIYSLCISPNLKETYFKPGIPYDLKKTN